MSYKTVYHIHISEDAYREMIEDAIDSYNSVLGHVDHSEAVEIAQDNAIALLDQNSEPIIGTRH